MLQLGYGDSAQRSVPPAIDVAVGGAASAIACGTAGSHVCVVLQLDGSVKCWYEQNLCTSSCESYAASTLCLKLFAISIAGVPIGSAS